MFNVVSGQGIEYTDFISVSGLGPDLSADLYSEALADSIFLASSEQHELEERDLITKLEDALKIGLPQDDEMVARLVLGETYYKLLRYKPKEACPMSHELRRAIQEMEASVIIDSQEGYEHFHEPINSARLQTLAAAYVKVSQRIQEEEGPDCAIAYVKQKLEFFNYLSSPPSLLLLNLGELYESKCEWEYAYTIFMEILDRAENPVDNVDSYVRRAARSRIR